MELILLAILALTVLGSVDRHLYPVNRPARAKRPAARRRFSATSSQRHRCSAAQVQPFLHPESLGRR